MNPEHERPRCPSCSSKKVAEIFFGLPSDIDALQPRLTSGEVILGGCSIPSKPPKWHCHDCENEWGESDWVAVLMEAEKERYREFQEAEKAAEQRGVMDAAQNANSYVKCPHCGRSFSIRHSMSWDGNMHKSCHTRIRITNGEQGGADQPTAAVDLNSE